MTVSTPTETQVDTHLAVVSSLGQELIQDRCKEQLTQEQLGRAIRTAIRCGASVDSLSEASGLRPEAVKNLIESNDSEENLAVLTGTLG